MTIDRTNLPKAYSYVRFSTPEQSKGDSLRRQTEAAEQYAKQNGLELDTSLTLHDLGIPAFHGRNVEEGRLGAFIKAVDRGRVLPGSYLLVESLDRLSRDRITRALALVQSLLEKSIIIVTLSDQKVYTRESLDEFADLMLSLLIMSRAHEESEMKSHRMKAVWKGKRAEAAANGKPLTAMVPNWLRLNKSVGEFEVIEPHAKIVERIFSMYVNNGLGKMAIAQQLNEEGVAAFSSRADGWHHSYIGRILTNGAVIGRFQPTRYEVEDGKRRNIPDGPEIEGYYPTVIDRDTFFRAEHQRQHRTLSSGRRGNGFPNLFRGVAKCGVCSGTMNFISKGHRRATSKAPNTYLQCSNARRVANKCAHSALWPYGAVEHFVTEGISDIDFSSLFPSITAASRKDLEAITVSLNAAKGELSEVAGRVENATRLLIERPESRALLAELDSLEERRDELEAAIDRLETMEVSAREQLGSIDARYRNQEEALDQWRASKEDAALRASLNRSLSANIERMEFHPEEGGAGQFSHIVHHFKQGDRDWTLFMTRWANRGEFAGTTFPFGREDWDMKDGGESMWYPPEIEPDPEDLV